MKNFFGKVLAMKESLKNQIVSKTESIIEGVRKKVGVLSAAAVLGVSSNVMAADWHKVTVAGEGPQAFAEQNFGTREWQKLVDKSGRTIKNPNTDLILGREYTIQSEGTKIILEKKSSKGVSDTTQKPTQPKQETNIIDTREESKVTKIVPKVELVTKGTPSQEVKESTRVIKKEVEAKKLKKEKKERVKTDIAPTKEELEPFVDINYDTMMRLPGFRDFSMDTYYQAIGKHESAGGNQFARNDAKGEELGVDPYKFAYGWPQFTVGTLERYGIYLIDNGRIIEARVKKFLKDKELQDELMNQYTTESLVQIQKSPKLIHRIVSGKVSLPAILAKGHIAGHGSIGFAWGGKDWLGTDVRAYARNVERAYEKFSTTQLAQNEMKEISTIPSTEKLVQVDTELPVVQNIQTAVNDEVFTQESTPLTPTLSVIRGVKDATMKAQLQKRFASYNSEQEALVDNKQKMLKEANRLEQEALSQKKLALTIFGPSREKFLKEARKYQANALNLRKRANDIDTIIASMNTTGSMKKAA